MAAHLVADVPQKVLLAHEGKVLLTLDVDGTWQPPGGRLHVDEQPFDGVRREIREELGVEIELGPLFDTFVFTGASGQPHFVVIYLGTLKGSVPEFVPDPEEIAELRWFGPGEFEELTMRDGYKAALRRLFRSRPA